MNAETISDRTDNRSIFAILRRSEDGELVFGVAFALLVGLANRTLIGWHAPLWLDETFTAVIATQDRAGPLWHWLTHELGGPLYYLVDWGWEKIGGNSNVSLRFPSYVASVATLFVILRWGHPDRRTRLIWAALMALYTPSFVQATEARCYSLLILLGTVQGILFLHLLHMPSLKKAALWVGVSSLCILTHYHAGVISAVQGLVYLAYCREKALRTWPALFVLAPCVAWMSVHLPFVIGYAASGSTWYNVVSPLMLFYMPIAFVDFPLIGAGLLLVVWLTVILCVCKRGFARECACDKLVMLTAGSGIAAALLVFGLGCISASLSMRYFMPFVPVVLMGVAALVQRLDRIYARTTTLLLVVLSIFGLGLLGNAIAHPQNDRRYTLNFELPSDWIASHGGGRNLVFLWDNPTADFSDPHNLDEVAGFFLRRLGEPTKVHVARMARGVDPFPRLVRVAERLERSSILWSYDVNVPFSRGGQFPVKIDRFPAWECHRFGSEEIVTVACVRRRSSAREKRIALR